ncbi:hypothetical protein PybrP1_008786, partial [[Pythium] brassicae (nom. inval.)]
RRRPQAAGRDRAAPARGAQETYLVDRGARAAAHPVLVQHGGQQLQCHVRERHAARGDENRGSRVRTAAEGVPDEHDAVPRRLHVLPREAHDAAHECQAQPVRHPHVLRQGGRDAVLRHELRVQVPRRPERPRVPGRAGEPRGQVARVQHGRQHGVPLGERPDDFVQLVRGVQRRDGARVHHGVGREGRR